MNTLKQADIGEYKRCAAKGCSKRAIHCFEILYVDKKGWFCESCKNSLAADGLLIQDTDLAKEC